MNYVWFEVTLAHVVVSAVCCKHPLTNVTFVLKNDTLCPKQKVPCTINCIIFLSIWLYYIRKQPSSLIRLKTKCGKLLILNT